MSDVILAVNYALGSDLLKNIAEYRHAADSPFQEWIEKHPRDAVHLGRDLETRLLVVVDPATSPRCMYRLVYDGRNQIFPEEGGGFWPERAVILNSDGSFRVAYSSWRLLSRKLQPLFPAFKNTRKTMLWQLLKLKQPFPDPRNYEEVALALGRVPPDQLPNVSVAFVSFRGKRKMWHGSYFNVTNTSTERRLSVEALPSSDYGLTFRLWKRRAPKKKDKAAAQRQEEIPPPQPEPELWQNCRSSCAKLHRWGLNLAYDLGLLDKDERKKICEKLALTAAALVVHYDEPTRYSRNGRLPAYLTYADVTCTHMQKINFVEPAACPRTVYFASYLWSVRRQALVDARRAILQDLMAKLEQFPLNLGSLYRRCKLTLQKCIQEQHYILFCKDDSDLHHLKGFVAEMFYTCRNNKNKKIQMRLTTKNDLVALTCPSFRVFNLKQYLDLDQDPTLKKFWDEAPGPQNKKRPREDEDYEERAKFGETLAGKIVNSWLGLCGYLLEKFDYELASASYASMATLASKAVESKFLTENGPLEQGREKLKPYYAKMLRQSLKGGFHFSAQLLLYSGGELAVGPGGISETMFCPGPNGEQEKAASLCEYDINSSYGFSASDALLPGGFCVGYVAEDFAMDSLGFANTASGRALLKRPDGLRSETYEFRAVFHTLQKILDAGGAPIRSVYSNFHSKGLFGVDKCYLDLAVIFEDGRVKLYNFDPAYTHGCSVCPPLKSYVGGQSHDRVRSATEERDKIIREWTRGCARGNVDYEAVSDCCHLTRTALDAAFSQRRELQHLRQFCPPQRALSKEELLEWLERRRHNRDFTYVAWIEGTVPEKKKENCTPLLLHPRLENFNGQELKRTTGNTAVLMTRDYLEYLQDDFDFEILAVRAVLFFGVDHRTSNVYRQVSGLRSLRSDPLETNFLKKVLNLSLGYTALNAQKSARPKYYFGPLPKKIIDPNKCQVLLDFGMTERGEDDPLLSLECRRAGANKNRIDNLGYLPFYTTVIERGRMRLAEFIVFLQEYLPPHTFRLLYCNTDNLQFVCSAADWESLVCPDLVEEFHHKKTALISDLKIPGFFKLEWRTLPPFKYVTASPFNWSLSSEQFFAQKWSGLSKLTAQQSFDNSCKLLRNEQFTVEQLRRQDKIRSLACETVTLTFNKKQNDLPNDVGCDPRDSGCDP